MKTPGRFISIEGGDGSGKSTQAKKLAATLKKRGIAVTMTREPGGSPGAEDIRALLVNGKPGRWDGLSETLLLYAARHDHVEHTIKPALAQGRWVISDRFADSTYAYQGAGQGMDRETIRRIESVSIGSFKPALTIVLDLPAGEGLKRAAGRGAGESRYEHFDRKFHEKLRQGYLDIARKAHDRCVVIDAAKDEKTVAEEIFAVVAARFALK